MEPKQFIDKWRRTTFGERQGAQSFFNDICALVDHPTPAEFGNPDIFTFEKWVPGGFADAYYEDHFGWEFKSSDADLNYGMNQLLRYQIHLKTPPLLIVSSFRTIRIQTNFPGMETVQYEIPVTSLFLQEYLEQLRRVFHSPSDFRPNRTVAKVTGETANLFHKIVADMELLDADPEKLARYLNQIVFCLFAEDAGILRNELFTQTVQQQYRRPAVFDEAVRDLFGQMARGGRFGPFNVDHFDGDLFNAADTVQFSRNALLLLNDAINQNWRNIEPSIFGTLFERALDASKRSQLGAHYTGAEDIEQVVEPVVIEPLRREWETARQEVNALIDNDDSAAARVRLEAFQQRLASVTVLDPACGSGNFLYIALRSLLDLEKQLIDFNDAQGWPEMYTSVRPNQMLGLEINPYAAELSRTALWIGYIQWHISNGIRYRHIPILAPMNNSIRQTDAILSNGDTQNPQETEWPPAEFIIGNPPFLGSLPFRRELGDDYANAVYGLFGGRIPNASDYCCYWFEKARAQIESGKTRRAGLLATQAIRFQNNRRVLARIKETGDIFAAISDRNWILEGANVHISIIGFDNGAETNRTLDGVSVSSIHSNLTSNGDITQAQRLAENAGIAFAGEKKHGPFEIDQDTAEGMMQLSNPNGKPNSDVVKLWMVGRDINGRASNRRIIDFGVDLPEDEAALYEAPFEYIRFRVKPERDNHRDARLRQYWWLHGRPRIDMRQALSGLPRYIVTSQVSKYRLFSYVDGQVLPDATLVVFARDDDYFFGVMHSRIHEVWALAMGTQLESRPRYIISACFETFPFPEPDDAQRAAIADAAARLNQWRENALRDDARETLTRLYNRRPTWLDNAHNALDAAVAAAYGWPAGLDNAAILERLLALNLQRRG